MMCGHTNSKGEPDLKAEDEFLCQGEVSEQAEGDMFGRGAVFE